MKKKLLLILFFSFFLFPLFSAKVKAFTKYDFLKYVGQKVSVAKAYSEYELCNPTNRDIVIPRKAKDYFNWYFKEVKGNLKNSWFEIRINQTYDEMHNNYTKICNPYKNINGTITKNCSFILGTPSTYAIKKWRWVWKSFNPIGKTFVAKKCFNFRIYGIYELAYRNEVAIDNVIEIAGYNFDEYDWWNASFNLRKNETVETVGNVSLTDFPYVVNGTGFNLKELVDANKMRGDCKDLVAINSTEDELNYEWESYYNSSYGCNSTKALIWTQSNIEGDNSTINSWYYNYSEETAWHNSTSAVWDSDYKLVYHLGERDGIFTSSSTGFYNGTITDAYRTDSIFGYGVNFTGGNDKINVTDGEDLDSFIGMTIETWIRFTRMTGAYASPIYKAGVYNMYIKPTNELRCYAILVGGSADVSGITKLEAGKWYHLACLYNGTHLIAYVNGTEENRASQTGNLTTNANPTVIGNTEANAYPVEGIQDEIRISSIGRSPEYIKRQYEYGLATLQAEEQYVTPTTTTTTTTTTLPSAIHIALIEETEKEDNWYNWFYQTTPYPSLLYSILWNVTNYITQYIYNITGGNTTEEIEQAINQTKYFNIQVNNATDLICNDCIGGVEINESSLVGIGGNTTEEIFSTVDNGTFHRYSDTMNVSNITVCPHNRILKAIGGVWNCVRQFPSPDYNSGWTNISQGETIQFFHNLNLLGGTVDKYIVDLQFAQVVGNFTYPHNKFYGGSDASPSKSQGAYWNLLTANAISVKREDDDDLVDQIRVRMWIYD